jgi:hypothetical protein
MAPIFYNSLRLYVTAVTELKVILGPALFGREAGTKSQRGVTQKYARRTLFSAGLIVVRRRFAR